MRHTTRLCPVLEHSSVDDQSSTWFRAQFESLPNLTLINEYRKLTGPDAPMFLVHIGAGSGQQADFYLPPGSARLVQRINSKIPVPRFDPCERPSRVGIKLLFGDESEMEKYFSDSLDARGI